MKKQMNARAKAPKSSKKLQKTKDIASMVAMVPQLVSTVDKLGHSLLDGKGRRDGYSVADVPVGVATQMKPSFKAVRSSKCVKAIGTDFLQSLIIPSAASNVTGGLLIDVLVNPLVLANTRLAQMAPMFRRFRFTKFNLTYLPNQGTNTNGTLVMAFDHDAEQGGVPNPGAGAVQELMAWNDTRTGSMFTPLTMTSTLRIPDSPYWMDLGNTDTVRHNFQGQALAMLANPVSVASGAAVTYPVTMGSVWVQYECELYDEQLNANLSQGVVVYRGTTAAGTPSNTSKVGWNALNVTLNYQDGDVDDFPIVKDTAGNAGVALSRGVYTLIQQVNLTSPTGAVNCQYLPVTFVANIPSEQSAFGEENVTATAINNTNVAATANGSYCMITTLVVPDGGGVIFGNWGGTFQTANNFAITIQLQRVGAQILRTLQPPTEASSAARCRMRTHPNAAAPLSPVQAPLAICCSTVPTAGCPHNV